MDNKLEECPDLAHSLGLLGTLPKSIGWTTAYESDVIQVLTKCLPLYPLYAMGIGAFIKYNLKSRWLEKAKVSVLIAHAISMNVRACII